MRLRTIDEWLLALISDILDETVTDRQLTALCAKCRIEEQDAKSKEGKRPAEPCATGRAGGEFHWASEPAGSSGGKIQPLGLGRKLLDAKVSFHPLGVSCQMSLLG